MIKQDGTKVSPTGQISLQVTSLLDILSKLHSVIDDLENKTQPLVMPESATPPDCTGEKREQLAPLADQLYDCYCSIANACRQLQALNEKIQL